MDYEILILSIAAATVIVLLFRAGWIILKDALKKYPY